MAILAKYSEYTNVFLKKLATKLFKNFNIYKYTINPKLGKQSLYELIYGLKLLKLKTLKFIWRSIWLIILSSYLNLLLKLQSSLFKSLIVIFTYLLIIEILITS